MIAVSSGSTGEPTFWPRFLSDELPVAARFEQVFHRQLPGRPAAHARRRLLRARHLGGRHVHGGLLPPPRGQGLSGHGGHARQQQRRDLARRARAGAAVRADGAARLSAVPQGRHRQRHRAGARLAAAEGEAGDGRRGLQRGVAHPRGRAARLDRLRATTRRRSTAPPTPACSATRRRSRSASAASSRASPEAARRALRRVAAAHARAVRSVERYLRGGGRRRGQALLFSGDNGVPLVRYHIADNGGLVPYDAMLALPRRLASTAVAALAADGRRGVHSCPSSTCSGARTSRSRTSAPTSIRRTSASASSRRTCASG